MPSQIENAVFGLGSAKAPPVLSKDSESREQKKQACLFFYAETYPILSRDSESRAPGRTGNAVFWPPRLVGRIRRGVMVFPYMRCASPAGLAQQQRVDHVQRGVVARVCPAQRDGMRAGLEIEVPPQLVSAAVPVGRHCEVADDAAVNLDLDARLVTLVAAVDTAADDYALALGLDCVAAVKVAADGLTLDRLQPAEALLEAHGTRALRADCDCVALDAAAVADYVVEGVAETCIVDVGERHVGICELEILGPLDRRAPLRRYGLVSQGRA